jgi:hypothetical protein
MASLVVRRLAEIVAAAVIAIPCLAEAQPPKTDTTRGLNIRYADGQVSTRPLHRTGGMWTAAFPRIPGADTVKNGVPLTTLDIKHVVDGSTVVVTVTLFYGGPGQHGTTVAIVRLSDEQPIRVDELRTYGVEPITLSLVTLDPSTAYAPDVVSVSGQVATRAEAIGANVSAYRVFVTNRSSQPLMWVQFKAYRADRLAVLVRPRGKRNQPLIQPNAEYTFEISNSTAGTQAADGSETWQPLDRVELTAAMWQDAAFDGDPAAAADQRRVDLLRATQLELLLAELRAAPGRPLTSLRADVARGMTSDLETRRARDSIVADLDRFIQAQATSTRPEFRTWLAGTISEYEQWLARIARPAP